MGRRDPDHISRILAGTCARGSVLAQEYCCAVLRPVARPGRMDKLQQIIDPRGAVSRATHRVTGVYAGPAFGTNEYCCILLHRVARLTSRIPSELNEHDAPRRRCARNRRQARTTTLSIARNAQKNARKHNSKFKDSCKSFCALAAACAQRDLRHDVRATTPAHRPVRWCDSRSRAALCAVRFSSFSARRAPARPCNDRPAGSSR